MALRDTPVESAFQRDGIQSLTFRSQIRALLGVGRLMGYLRRHDIRVIHAHKSSDMRIMALVASLSPESRVFFTEHMGVKKPKKDLYHRWAYSKARRVFSISQASYAWNLAALPVKDDQLQQLYPGIDLHAYEQPLGDMRRVEIRRSLGLPEGVIAIALPGRVSRDKGHEVWVEALGRLREIRGLPQWCGVVIGAASGKEAEPGGFKEQLIERVDQMGLSKQVVFAGFRDDLPTCLKAVEIACIPSVKEAFGLSVVESMAAGCSVIGSDSGAIPELIRGDRGRTADPLDPKDWAQTLAELLCDAGLRKELGEAASRWASKRFELGEHVRTLTNFYERA